MNWRTNNQNLTKDFLGSFLPKTPSKVLGPLVIYQNENVNVLEPNDTLNILHKPKIIPQENPYYQQQMPYPKTEIKIKTIKDKTINYISPLKPDKSGNKKTPIFVTLPPPIPIDNRIPSSSEANIPIRNNPQNAIKSDMKIQGHGNPEELLQFINQHPEISNYPSGSVLEINKVPTHVEQLLGGSPPITKSQIHLVPYLVPTNSAGELNHNNLPPGFSLEHILNEFHKNSQPNSRVPLVNHPAFLGNNRPDIVPQQTGYQNNTQKG